MVIVNKLAHNDIVSAALVGNNSKQDLYNKFEQEYNKVVNAYHTAFAEAQSDPDKSLSWPDTYRRFSKEMHTALEQWKVFGYKNEIESALHACACHPLYLNDIIPNRIILA